MAGCGKQLPSVERGKEALPEDAVISDCAPGQYGGSFIVAETVQPTTFNPLVPSNSATNLMSGGLSAGLIGWDAREQKFKPSLAKSWEVSEDGLSYTFHLRKGIRWSDGHGFDANDVIFTYSVILAEKTDPNTGKVSPKYPSRYYSYYHYDGEPLRFEKIDDYTVRFSTPTVYAPFLYGISFPIMPEHVLGPSHANETFFKQWSTQTAINNPEAIVSLGAFVIESYEPGERLVLKPNPHYWVFDSDGNRLPYIDRMIFKFVNDINTVMLYFATGQLSFAGTSSVEGLRPSDYSWVKGMADKYNIILEPRGRRASAGFLWFNQKSGYNEDGEPFIPHHKRKWFTDRRFRQAMMYGFDRQAVVDSLYGEHGEAIHSLIYPLRKGWYNPDVKKYNYDPEKAAELLHEMGFRKRDDGWLYDREGHRLEFTIQLPTGSQNNDIMLGSFRANLEPIGVKVNIQSTDFATLLDKMDYTHDYDAGLIGWGSNSSAYDPSGSKSLYLSEGINHIWNKEQKSPETEWEARIDELFRFQESTLDPEKRYEAMHEIQAILAEELPLLYVVTYNLWSGYQRGWQNVYIPPTGTPYWNIEELWYKEK